MGWRIIARFIVGLVLGVASWARAGDIEDPPTMSLRVVAKNGVALPFPSPFVEASPGDILTTEIFIRCWSNGMHSRMPGVVPLLRGYQATILYNSYFSGSKGNILPRDFHETTEFPDDNCNNSSTDPVIQNVTNFFVDTTRPDYILGNQVFASPAGSGTCNYQVAGAICFAGCPGVEAICPPAELKYAGTLILQVSSDAIGTFRICFDDRDAIQNVDGPDFSSLRPIGGNLASAILPLNFECATISVIPEKACDRTITSSIPPDGSVDPGQPSGLDNTTLTGLQSVDLIIEDGDLGCLSSSDFTVAVFPDGPAPVVETVQITGPQSAQITLSDPIPPGKWTRITLNDDTPTSTRIGFLPGDISNDYQSNADDVLFLMNCLVGMNCPVHSLDTDRSGALSVLDLAREIDILLGADALDSWLGEMLPPLEP